ncbi:MAG: 4Fe-4S dicluster domain-containing protein [Deltaproteobacteria bacterium]|nr:4Fe-4S dicluster domain-containing protein [Deltaproteobacteria bacterium]
MKPKRQKIGEAVMMGNEAIARGLLEAGVQCATSYPGTPASEILEAVIRFRNQEKIPIFAEWAINEKVAFEQALAQSYLGRRSAVSMKQVGLNVASDPLMSAAYIGVKGGFVIISADDPGPKSSQTEQDSRFQAWFAKIPVFDPSSPLEAKEMVARAFELSEKYALPVLLRPTTRVCHARQPIPLYPLPVPKKEAAFDRNPTRWAATPGFRFILHKELNQKLAQVAEENPVLRNWKPESEKKPLAIVAAGVPYALAHDVLLDQKMLGQVPLFKIDQPYPLPTKALKKMLKPYKTVLVLEETSPVIELQLADGLKLRGRRDESIPPEGELTPDIVHRLLGELLGWEDTGELTAEPKGRRPTLCPGCPHRSSFWAIKKTFPKGLYPGDIGCYTLGMNMGVVDTCLCMGASISTAAGLFQGFQYGEQEIPPIVATIGDSTFFHAGLPALVNAVHQKARFILVILDNSIVAMTGGQPAPNLATLSDGRPAVPIDLKGMVRACGVEFIREVDPYDFPRMTKVLKEAGEYIKQEESSVAVVIARHPCLVYGKHLLPEKAAGRVVIPEDECDGCGVCVTQFDCPAITQEARKTPARIQEEFCTNCGTCLYVCPKKHIRREAS